MSLDDLDNRFGLSNLEILLASSGLITMLSGIPLMIYDNKLGGVGAGVSLVGAALFSAYLVTGYLLNKDY